ncbi:hypothetical protein E3C22_18195 [Jiella endophytica]|uniref:Uncharacterized protein n=1 Tax=Jiella endophytica TaxID=2558362 RepID=A0A4Y8RFP4_9HYPH|nr:hypothetical protein [Jiella endophytica]TFF20819.1 hypothetical protein E3C22_18195 [Jiella endophytica]
MDAKQSYEVTEAGFLFGDYYRKGGSIELNPKQARRFIDEGRIADPTAARTSKAAPKTDPKAGGKQGAES